MNCYLHNCHTLFGSMNGIVLIHKMKPKALQINHSRKSQNQSVFLFWGTSCSFHKQTDFVS